MFIVSVVCSECGLMERGGCGFVTGVYSSDRPILIFLEPIPIICTFMYLITDMQNRYLFTVIK